MQLVPVSDPAVGKWRPTGERAFYELRGEVPRGWVLIELVLRSEAASAPRLLIDDQRDVPLPAGNRVTTVLELPGAQRLVLEVGKSAQVQSVVLKPISAAEAALRMAAPVVKRRFQEPWTLPIAAVKVIRRLLTGELLPGLHEKERRGDPHHWYERWYKRFAELTERDRTLIRAQLPPGPRFQVLGDAGNQLYRNFGRDDGEYVLRLEPGDELTEHALYLMALAARSTPDVIYGDEDSIDAEGKFADPQFKPDWNPDLFFSTNYPGRCVALRKGITLETARSFVHVPFVLLHTRSAPPPPAPVPAPSEPGPFPLTRRVRWPIPEPQPLVSLIIPTRNRRELLEPCIESLRKTTGYRNYEIIVVDNGSTEPATLEYLTTLPRVVRHDAPFNFSTLNNLGVREARGSIVGLINNDLEFTDPGWLEEMVSHAVRPDIGAVGARLLYPDGTVQHAGVVVGIGGIADHVHKDLPADAPGYCGRARLTQNFSAVTAACLLVRKQVYEEVGGLDESFAVAYNDVDFCLRIAARGLRNVWTPFATVIHHESKSRGRDNTWAKARRFRGEQKRFAQRWREVIAHDPAYNPNLTVQALNFGLAIPPRVKKPWLR